MNDNFNSWYIVSTLHRTMFEKVFVLFVKVDLVRAQLRRASNKYESMSNPKEKKLQARSGSVKWMISNDVKSMSSVDDGDVESQHHRPRNRDHLTSFDSLNSCFDDCSSVVHSDMEDVIASKSQDEVKKPVEIEIPENFLCPISFELMLNPVIVSTGQVRTITIDSIFITI